MQAVIGEAGLSRHLSDTGKPNRQQQCKSRSETMQRENKLECLFRANDHHHTCTVKAKKIEMLYFICCQTNTVDHDDASYKLEFFPLL